MRTLFLLATLTGATAMTTTLDTQAQEKKDEPKKAEKLRVNEPAPGSDQHKEFPETVVIREWAAREKIWIVPVQTKAELRESKGVIYWRVWSGFGPVGVGSEITHKGTTYVVKSAIPGTVPMCIVEKKPAEEKKP